MFFILVPITLFLSYQFHILIMMGLPLVASALLSITLCGYTHLVLHEGKDILSLRSLKALRAFSLLTLVYAWGVFLAVYFLT